MNRWVSRRTQVGDDPGRGEELHEGELGEGPASEATAGPAPERNVASYAASYGAAASISSTVYYGVNSHVAAMLQRRSGLTRTKTKPARADGARGEGKNRAAERERSSASTTALKGRSNEREDAVSGTGVSPGQTPTRQKTEATSDTFVIPAHTLRVPYAPEALDGVWTEGGWANRSDESPFQPPLQPRTGRR